MEEIWKPIKGYEGLYEVSNLGNVRSLDHITIQKTKGNVTVHRLNKGRMLKCGRDKDNYCQVSLCKDGKAVGKKVHRLVAEQFIPKIDGKNCINHIDCDRRNNRVDNLEWCTPSENVKHEYKCGRVPNRAKRVTQYDNQGRVIKHWETIKEIEKTLKIFSASVSRVCKQKRGTAGGYIWRYTE